MANFPPIVLTGSIAIDRIMSFSGKFSDYLIPEKLDVISISVFLDQLIQANGGVGANIAYSLALLGNEPHLVGSVGKDAAAYMDKLAHDGVNITHVFESNLPTASFNAITDKNLNQVSGFYPGAMFDSGTQTFEPWKDLNPVIIISPHDPKAMDRQIDECIKWNLKFCYDIGQQVSNTAPEYMAKGIKAAEMLITNDYELSLLSKKTGISIDQIRTTVPIVITTLGEKGSEITGKYVPNKISVGIAKPDKIADPTGAGDAFRSGFIHGFIRGWSLKESAQLGAVCSSYAIEVNGTQTHRFTVNEVAKRYELNFKEKLPS